MRTSLRPVTTRPRRLAAVAASVFLATSVHAWTNDEQPRTVAEVGTHNPNLGFVHLAESVSSLCVYQLLYFDIQTAVGKAMMAGLIIAKSSGQKISVGYDTPAALGSCTLQMASLIS